MVSLRFSAALIPLAPSLRPTCWRARRGVWGRGNGHGAHFDASFHYCRSLTYASRNLL